MNGAIVRTAIPAAEIKSNGMDFSKDSLVHGNRFALSFNEINSISGSEDLSLFKSATAFSVNRFFLIALE